MSGEILSDKYQAPTSQESADYKTIKDSNMSVFEMAVAVFGHEIEHATNANVRVMEQENKGNFSQDSETKPQAVAGKIIQDLKQKK